MSIVEQTFKNALLIKISWYNAIKILWYQNVISDTCVQFFSKENYIWHILQNQYKIYLLWYWWYQCLVNDRQSYLSFPVECTSGKQKQKIYTTLIHRGFINPFLVNAIPRYSLLFERYIIWAHKINEGELCLDKFQRSKSFVFNTNFCL